MAPMEFELDPDADAIIALKNPGAPFAVWQEPSTAPHDQKPASSAEKDEQLGNRYVPPRLRGKESPIVSDGWYSDEGSSVADESDSPLDEDNVLDSSNSFAEEIIANLKSRSSKHKPDQTPPDSPPFETEQDLDGNVIYFRVSSRHLVLPSKFFKSCLMKDGWIEASRNATDGKYHLSAEDWDPEPLRTLLAIWHLKFDIVPEELDLEMLAKMAVLVDYYCCTEAVGPYSKMWISAAKASYPVPTVYNRDLVLWMLIAWVFKLPDVFKETTKIAVRQVKMPMIQDMGLPIPTSVLEAMERSRYEAIENLLVTLEVWASKFRANSYSCPSGTADGFECSSILLGALYKEMDRIGYGSPRPEVPFSGISYEQLVTDVQNIKSPEWRYGNGYSRQKHECNFTRTIIPEVRTLYRKWDGLDLSKFEDGA